MLAALAALFVLMAGVWPLRRARNIDAMAAASLVVPVVLLQQRYLGASVLAALPGLLWLLGRSLWWAFADHAVAAPSQSLFGVLTRSWPSARRVRVLRLLLLALGLVFLMVGVSSPQPVDVLYAVMEGATRLLHGALPYGHMPGDIVHGDTYPVLSYLLYTPVALVAAGPARAGTASTSALPSRSWPRSVAPGCSPILRDSGDHAGRQSSTRPGYWPPSSGSPSHRCSSPSRPVRRTSPSPCCCSLRC